MQGRACGDGGEAMIIRMLMILIAVLTLGVQPVLADDEHDRPARDGIRHESTGHYIRHLLKHPKEIGLTADQVAKLKAIQLDLNRTRVRAEAEVQVAELELASGWQLSRPSGRRWRCSRLSSAKRRRPSTRK